MLWNFPVKNRDINLKYESSNALLPHWRWIKVIGNWHNGKRVVYTVHVCISTNLIDYLSSKSFRQSGFTWKALATCYTSLYNSLWFRCVENWVRVCRYCNRPLPLNVHLIGKSINLLSGLNHSLFDGSGARAAHEQIHTWMHARDDLQSGVTWLLHSANECMHLIELCHILKTTTVSNSGSS